MQDQDTHTPPGDEQPITVDQLTVREQLGINYVRALINQVTRGEKDPDVLGRIERLLELESEPFNQTAVGDADSESPRDGFSDVELLETRALVITAGHGHVPFLNDAVRALIAERDQALASTEEGQSRIVELGRRLGILAERILELEAAEPETASIAPRTGPYAGVVNREKILDFIISSAGSGGVTNADIRSATDLSREVVDRHLRALVDEGDIVKSAVNGRAASYTMPVGTVSQTPGPTPAEREPETATSASTSTEPNGPAASADDSASTVQSPAAAADSAPQSSKPAASSSSNKPSSTTPAETRDDPRPQHCPECNAQLAYADSSPDRECTAACLGGAEPGGSVHRWTWNGLGQLRLMVPASSTPAAEHTAAQVLADPSVARLRNGRNDQALLDALTHGEMTQGAAGIAAGVPKGSVPAVVRRLADAGKILRRGFKYTAGHSGVALRLPNQQPRIMDGEATDTPPPKPAASAPAVPVLADDPEDDDGVDDDGVPPDDEAPVIGVVKPPAPPAVSRRVQKLLAQEKAEGPPPGVPDLDPRLSRREQQIIDYLRRNNGRVHTRNIAVSLVARVADVGSDLRRLMALGLVEKIGENQFQAARVEVA